MAGLDLSKLPKGELGWQQFVEAALSLDDRDERYFLELKSTIDLGTKDGRAKVAKFILGAANRDPVVSARRFGGHALLVIGIKDGKVVGVPAFEAKDLQTYVSQFTGSDGPIWDFERIRVGDRDVIVVVVDPPLPSKVFPCFADGPEKLFDGIMYIRVDGETRAAKGAELHALFARASAAPVPSAQISVEVVGNAKRRDDAAEALEAHLLQERTRLLESLEKEQHKKKMQVAGPLEALIPRRTYAELISPAITTGKTIEEDRTEAQFKRQIEQWCEAVRAAWPTMLDNIAAAAWDSVDFVLHNLSDDYLEEVEVEVHIPGAVDAVEPVERERFDCTKYLPDPPRKWGPRFESYLAGMPGAIMSANDFTPYIGVDRGISFRNGGSVSVTIGPVELRPGRSIKYDNELLLILREELDGPITATWSATVRGHNKRYEGSVTIAVDERVHNFSAGLRKVLDLDGGS